MLTFNWITGAIATVVLLAFISLTIAFILIKLTKLATSRFWRYGDTNNYNLCNKCRQEMKESFLLSEGGYPPSWYSRRFTPEPYDYDRKAY